MGVDGEHRRMVGPSRLLNGLGATAPIVQAPMAGAGGVKLAVAAMRGGAVGSLPCAMLSPEGVRAQVAEVRAGAAGPLNLNFFCHDLVEAPDDRAWRTLLAPCYAQEGVTKGTPPPLRRPFDLAMCAAVEEVRPDIVSFHFGLPDAALLARVRASGALVFGNATTPDEMRWLAAQGVDAVIAQGDAAGGHVGWFLDRHQPTPLARLLNTKIGVPIIAAGGLFDGAGIAAAVRAGAVAVQIGTAYLATPESLISPPSRALLGADAEACFTNLFSGREARGLVNRLIRELGPIRSEVPPFPYASEALAPLRAAAEADGRTDYSPLWAGAGVNRVRAMPAEALTRSLAREAAALL
jgi:nitronate monooxygenase